jgi:ABC-type amino acid transport substrate-binding protein
LLFAFTLGADDSKPLRVGMDTRSPPWSWVEGLDYSKEDQASDPAIGAAQLARVQGIDVDVARLVAQRLGRRLEVVPTAWVRLEAALVAGHFDAIIDAWTPTPQTPAAIVATRPYAHWGLVVVARATDRSILSFRDLDGRRVGHYRDPAVLRSLSALGKASLQPFDDPSALFEALRDQHLDAAAFDSPYVDWWLSRNPGFRRVGAPLNRLGYHIGACKADAELARALDEIASSLDGAPEMDAIGTRWGAPRAQAAPKAP